jgi:putative ABC transport system permease protein
MPSTVLIDRYWRDIRYAGRTLSKTPVFAVVAVLTLALGIGVNTAVFSVANAIILRPLPVKDGHRLAVIASLRSSTSTLGPVSFPDLQDYRAATRDIFDDMAGYSVGFIGLAPEGGRPHRASILVSWVTGNYFSLLGIQPAVGRLIRSEEGSPGRADPVVVLSHSTWQRRFGGDPSVVGRTAMLNGHPCTIIGVVPPEFVGTFAFSESEVYVPVNWIGSAALDDRGARGLHTVARLRPGVAIDRAQATLDVVAARLEQEHPDADRGIKVKLLPERLARPQEDNARSNAFAATIVLALVGLVLLVAEINVTTLLLARAITRRRELAIRAALGASRGSLIRQLLTESAMLAVLGGIAGVVLGAWTAQLLTAVRLPGDLPGRLDFHLDSRVLAYAVALTTATALLIGLIAARHASRTSVGEALHDCRHGPTPVGGGHRTRKALVVAQIAACFVLLVAGGLFMRSLGEAEHANFGFRAEGVLNLQMDVAHVGYSESRGQLFFDEVERRVAKISSVKDLAFACTVPMGYVRLSRNLVAEGLPVSPS